MIKLPVDQVGYSASLIAEDPIFKGVGLITEGKQTNNCAAIYLQLVEEFSSLQQFKDKYFFVIRLSLIIQFDILIIIMKMSLFLFFCMAWQTI